MVLCFKTASIQCLSETQAHTILTFIISCCRWGKEGYLVHSKVFEPSKHPAHTDGYKHTDTAEDKPSILGCL